jgi:hypothetical protein
MINCSSVFISKPLSFKNKTQFTATYLLCLYVLIKFLNKRVEPKLSFFNSHHNLEPKSFDSSDDSSVPESPVERLASAAKGSEAGAGVEAAAACKNAGASSYGVGSAAGAAPPRRPSSPLSPPPLLAPPNILLIA